MILSGVVSLGQSVQRFFLRFLRVRQDESGAVIVFTLFVLVLMLIVSGMAVDFIRFSSHAARVQDTADRAAVAATKLTNGLDPEDVVEAYFASAGLSDSLGEIDIEGTGDYRRVQIDYDYGINTYFLKLAGMNQLEGGNASAAVQGVANIEISLVLDISASMAGTKIATLRTEAVRFAQTVLDAEYNGTVSLNVIPFAGDVDIGPEMFAHLNGIPTPLVLIEGADTPTDDTDDVYYPTGMSHCLIQSHTSLNSLDLPATGLEQVPHFHPHSIAFSNNAPWYCPVGATVQYAVQEAGSISDPTSLSYFLANIPMATATNSATGLNYGAALLNPTSRAAFDNLNNLGIVPDDFRGRPANYGDPGVQKILIFMSDGNPWQVGYPKDFFDPWNLGLLGEYGRGANNRKGVHNVSSRLNRTRTTAQSGTDFTAQCTLIKDTFANLTVVTVAFEASTSANTLLRNCASASAHAHVASEQSLGRIFADIAAQITELRVEQ